MNQEKDKHDLLYQELKAQGAKGWGGESYEKRMEGWSRTLAWLTPYLPQLPAKILDIGCGAGDSALPFALKGYHVSGLDISQTAIDWAIEKFSQHQLTGDFQVANLYGRWPWRNNEFDFVVDSATMHCVLGKDKRARAFSNILNVLKPQGKFLMSSMVGDPRDCSRLEFFNATERVQKVFGLPPRYTPHVNDLKNEILANGFSIMSENVQINSWWDHYNAVLVPNKN